MSIDNWRSRKIPLKDWTILKTREVFMGSKSHYTNSPFHNFTNNVTTCSYCWVLKWIMWLNPLKNYLPNKGGFYQKGMVNLFFLQTDKPNYFLNYFFLYSKWLKPCQMRTWSCTECSTKALEQLNVLIWHDLSHLEWKKFKTLAQENNLVCLFGEMTNSSALSE